MKIYTKKGDSGMTSLIGGSRVPKHHLRIESYGTVDELNAHLGLLRDQNIPETLIKDLLEIQDRLFTIGSLLAAEPGKSKMDLPKVFERDIVFLENRIDEMDEEGYNDRGEREHGPSASQIQEEEETQKLYGGLNHTTYIVRGTSFSCCKRKQVFSTPLLHFQTKTNFKQRQMPNRLQNNSV
jgi:hypothetical protein